MAFGLGLPLIGQAARLMLPITRLSEHKATKVHGNTLCNFELAVITSLFDFGIKSPGCTSFEQLPSSYAGSFGLSSIQRFLQSR
jgi:hypothetical protein